MLKITHSSFVCQIALIYLASFLFLSGSVLADSSGRMTGRASFKAGHNVIWLPEGTSRIVIDTNCINCYSHFPSWRFIGSLLIDSVTIDGISVPYSSEYTAQRAGIQINSPNLIFKLDSLNVRVLGKRFPESQPFDTIYCDSITQRSYILPDLSMWYYATFSTQLNLDSVFVSLQQVSDLQEIGPIPETYTDDYTLAWVPPPNDSLYPEQWALDSIQIECAWTKSDSLGNVKIAIIDEGTRWNHEDLDSNIVGGDTTYFEDHGTEVAGIVAAMTNNQIGIAGVAPRGKLLVYDYTFDSVGHINDINAASVLRLTLLYIWIFW